MRGYLIVHKWRLATNFNDIIVYHDSFSGNQDHIFGLIHSFTHFVRRIGFQLRVGLFVQEIICSFLPLLQ